MPKVRTDIARFGNTVEWYRSHFEALESALNGAASSAMHALRREAMAQFERTGFPTVKDEEWKYTNVAPIAGLQFRPAERLKPHGLTKNDIAPYTFGGLHCSRLVFVNGHFAPDLSGGATSKGVRATNLASLPLRGDGIVDRYLAKLASMHTSAFTALNTAFIEDGAFIVVPDNVVVSDPVHLLFLSTAEDEPHVVQPRNLIVVGSHSKLSVVETYATRGDAVHFTNVVTEIVVGEGAVIEHDKLQKESDAAFHVGSIHVHQQARSVYVNNAITLGGTLVRNNITSVLDAPGCECTLNGLSLGTGSQHIDNHTTIDHASPNCISHELYKSILDGSAHGVFNGKIFVRKDAQKTDAKQTNKTLLLSQQASIDTKPQLEIFADDVKCTHGATVGQLDEEQIFYLRSRGLSVDVARDLLTLAFAGDVIERVHIAPLREQLDRLIHERLLRGRTLPER